VLYLSAWLSNKKVKKKKSLDMIAEFSFILLPVVLILILQPDISTLLLLLFSSGLVYFLAKTPLSHIFLFAGTVLARILVLTNTQAYRMSRFLVFLNPDIDPLGKSYQAKQALIAIGSGGLFGKGLGLSSQKFGFLPNVMSDSIFAAFCEETGFIGPFILIFLFLLFLIRVIKISSISKNEFAKILGSVLGAGIVFQAFLNMSAMLGIIPLTGVPLPFISYGGTHLVIELTMVGILLNISKS